MAIFVFLNALLPILYPSLEKRKDVTASVIVQGIVNKECWRYSRISSFAWKDEEISRKNLSQWHSWNLKRATSEYEEECQYWSCIAQPCYPCSRGDIVLMWCDVTFCCGCELPILTSGRTWRASLPAVQWDWTDKHSVHSIRVREFQVRFHKRPSTWTWGFLFIYLF